MHEPSPAWNLLWRFKVHWLSLEIITISERSAVTLQQGCQMTWWHVCDADCPVHLLYSHWCCHVLFREPHGDNEGGSVPASWGAATQPGNSEGGRHCPLPSQQGVPQYRSEKAAQKLAWTIMGKVLTQSDGFSCSRGWCWKYWDWLMLASPKAHNPITQWQVWPATSLQHTAEHSHAGIQLSLFCQNT